MAEIDADTVHREDARHLLDDGRSRGLDSVRAEDRTDVVRVDLVEVDNAVGKVPARLEVDSLGHRHALLSKIKSESCREAERESTHDGSSLLVRSLGDEAARDASNLVHDGGTTAGLDDADEEELVGLRGELANSRSATKLATFERKKTHLELKLAPLAALLVELDSIDI